MRSKKVKSSFTLFAEYLLNFLVSHCNDLPRLRRGKALDGVFWVQRTQNTPLLLLRAPPSAVRTLDF